jgi:hypothetical protein
MQLHPNWVASDPEPLRLEDVLKSGLHDDLHEDDIEDLQLHGRVIGRAAARDVDQIRRELQPVQALRPSILSLERSEVSRKRSRVPSAEVADEWFNHNYPKLKPEDLADHYRRNVLSPSQDPAPARPAISANPPGFDAYRNLLKAHVVNSNVAYENDVDPAEAGSAMGAAKSVADIKAAASPTLTLTPDMIAQRRLSASAKRPGILARLGFVALLTSIALVAGGAAGLLLADSSPTQGLLTLPAQQDQESMMVPELDEPVKLRN